MIRFTSYAAGVGSDSDNCLVVFGSGLCSFCAPVVKRGAFFLCAFRLPQCGGNIYSCRKTWYNIRIF